MNFHCKHLKIVYILHFVTYFIYAFTDLEYLLKCIHTHTRTRTLYIHTYMDGCSTTSTISSFSIANETFKMFLKFLLNVLHGTLI